MPDLHGWITQQIDATEEAAHKAGALCGCHPPAPSWSFRDGDESTDGRILVVDDPHPGLKRKIGRKWNGSYEGLFMAEHIVRHDPHAVLRRCTADRKILARHQPQQDGSGFPDSQQCPTCSQDGGDGYQYLVPYPCPTVLAVAEGYGDVPPVHCPGMAIEPPSRAHGGPQAASEALEAPRVLRGAPEASESRTAASDPNHTPKGTR